MAVEFNEKLNKKIYKYCLVAAKQYGHGGDKAIQFAKEVRQRVLEIIFHKLDYWNLRMSDNLLFITCKRQMYSFITSQNAKKNQIYLDSNQILLGQNSNFDYNLEIVDVTTEDDYIDATQKNQDRYNHLIKRIDLKLTTKELTKTEKQIFILFFLDNRKIKEIAKILKLTNSKVSKLIKNIKTTMRFDFKFENKKIKIIEI